MFETAANLASEYENALVRATVPMSKAAVAELRQRLRYLDVTLEMVDEALERLRELTDASTRAEPPTSERLAKTYQQADRARVLLETFYFNCGRVRELVRHDEWIPYIGEPGYIGAFKVRDKLIEHFDPSKTPVAQGPSFAVGSRGGPQLQIGMSPEWEDAGLEANSKELAEVLERRITTALGKLR